MPLFEKITPEMSEKVIQHLRDSFFADEPLNKAVGLCKRGEPHAALEEMCQHTISDGYSLAAVDDCDNIMGVALNGVLKPCDVENAFEKLQESKDEKFKKVFTILYSLNLKCNYFETYGVDRLLECRIISIAPRGRGMGLGKQLMERSIQVARDEGFKLFKADATGAFSQNICLRLGFQEAISIMYSEYVDSTCKPVFKVEPPHRCLSIMLLDLRNDKK